MSTRPSKYTGETKTEWQGKYLRIRRHDCGWEFVERANSCGGVILIAITADGKLLITQQYRVPMGCDVLELPAGLAGDIPGSEEEPLVEAARRELWEETGYHAEQIVRVAAGPTSPGLTNEHNTMFLATGLKRVGEGGGDESEDITLHEVPMEELPSWLAAQAAAGIPADPKIFAGLYFVQQHQAAQQ